MPTQELYPFRAGGLLAGVLSRLQLWLRTAFPTSGEAVTLGAGDTFLLPQRLPTGPQCLRRNRIALLAWSLCPPSASPSSGQTSGSSTTGPSPNKPDSEPPGEELNGFVNGYVPLGTCQKLSMGALAGVARPVPQTDEPLGVRSPPLAPSPMDGKHVMRGTSSGDKAFLNCACICAWSKPPSSLSAPSSVTGSQRCRSRRHFFICPSQLRLLHFWSARGVTGCSSLSFSRPVSLGTLFM
mmetsp:Transcript_7875/g.14002  ORF Transcript_7875/g.14002 Transcript_7875/m.14002 type:complete len:239 (+) Transcript_7875:1187-1903(+)